MHSIAKRSRLDRTYLGRLTPAATLFPSPTQEADFLMLSSISRLPFLVLLVALSATATAQNQGVIFTTDENANQVTGNVFESTRAVYLSGGPSPGTCSGPGLPDGSYYFQVTSPSGSVLLSSDDLSNRIVIVFEGFIIGVGPGGHLTRKGACFKAGSRIVKLAPFANTPDPGDEYKVWLTPVENFSFLGGGFHGFLAEHSRCANFKVTESGGPGPTQSVIEGYKFYDKSENGLWETSNALEVPIPGWRIEIWTGGLPYGGGTFDGVTFTDASGRYEFIRPANGTTYYIREAAPCPGGVSLCAPDAGFLNATGSTTPAAPGARWFATTPRVAAIVASAPLVEGPWFGNIEFELAIGSNGAGPGRSKGFWHNAGRPLLLACDTGYPQVWRAALNAACLRNPISTTDPAISLFIPPPPENYYNLAFPQAFSNFSNWIVGLGAQGHAGYLLSTQVAATILNNTCGFMQGTIYIDRFQNNQLVSLAAMIQGAIGLLCSPGAGLTRAGDPPQPSPIPGVDLRTAMLNCVNEFDTINNTGSASNPQVIYRSKTEPSPINSPYEG